ncbi:hypothetical protein AYK26_01415 [Euryarchaeota archaeon SM23-78]|nr:MAG: hypothetical protein AYK26_01415 [Euryarchaeota archaeon SM23-78]MBW3001252.1 hypothetical protein [Candidatus Woesearchaeota archaeon]
MIPKTFFAKLAEKPPFVIFQNQVYQIAEGKSRDGFVRAGKLELGLYPSTTLDELEKFYLGLNSEEIFHYKKSFIEERLKQEMKSNREMQKYVDENKVLRFILYEVFPLFMEDRDGVDALLKGETIEEDKQKKSIDKLVMDAVDRDELKVDVSQIKQELLQELRPPEAQEPELTPEEDLELDSLLTNYYKQTGILEQKPVAKRKKQSPDTELTNILGNNDVLVFKGLVYRLSPFKGEQGICINIGKQNYSLIQHTTVDEVEYAYQNKLEAQFNVQAVDEFEEQINQIRELKEQNKALEKFFEKTEYDAGNVGFKKHGSDYYVYAHVPEHVLKDVKNPSEDRYYRFGKCRVAVRVYYNRDKDRFEVGDPRVIETYSHPFLSYYDPWQTICMGTYSRSKLGRLDDASKVATLLSDARNVLLSGYTQSCGPYHRAGNFSNRKISKEQIKRKKLPITNVHKENLLKKLKEVF